MKEFLVHLSVLCLSLVGIICICGKWTGHRFVTPLSLSFFAVHPSQWHSFTLNQSLYKNKLALNLSAFSQRCVWHCWPTSSSVAEEMLLLFEEIICSRSYFDSSKLAQFLQRKMSFLIYWILSLWQQNRESAIRYNLFGISKAFDSP